MVTSDPTSPQFEAMRVMETFIGARALWPESVRDVQLAVHGALPPKQFMPAGDPEGVRIVDVPAVLATIAGVVADDSVWGGRAAPQRTFLRAVLDEIPEPEPEDHVEPDTSFEEGINFYLSDEELEARAPAPEYA